MDKKKVLRITSLCMLIFSILFIVTAATHPELSFPWNNYITYIIYGFYLVFMFFLFFSTLHISKRHLLLVVMMFIIIYLELLPYGAVLNFGTPEGNIIRRTVSYFSLIPFGYANFGPLITAWLSVISLIFLIVFCFIRKTILLKLTKIIICISLISSLFPLFLGFKYYSIVGALISSLLIIVFIFIKSSKIQY